MTKKPLRIAIFASGTGSNAMALINKAKTFTPETLTIAFVLSDRPEAPVLLKAAEAGVRTFLIEKKKDRATHEQEILLLLREYRIDWILLAGYMRILSSSFLHKFAEWHNGASQVVNIHPSLLPLYPGVDSIKRAFADKVEKSGVSLHLVDEGMDTGDLITQGSIELKPNESLDSWTEKFHKLEHQMYTDFLESLVVGQQKSFSFEEKP